MDRERRAGSSAAVAVAAGLLVVPVLADLALNGTRGLFRYVAADSFYYLQVARTWAETGLPSFDGTRATNGFHPLWQAMLAATAEVLQAVGLGDTALLWAGVLGSLALLLVAVVLLGHTLASAHGAVTPWFALLPLGLYAVTLIPLWLWLGPGDERERFWGELPLYGTLWSFANAMETSAVLAAFAALLLATVRGGFGSRRAVAAMAVAAALLVLARLDTAPIVAAWITVLLASAWLCRDAAIARAALVIAVVVGATVGAYLLVNVLYSGRPMPVSGTTKSSFPDPSLANLRDFADLLRGDRYFARDRLYRHWPMLMPALVALIWIGTQLRGLRRAPAPTPPDALARYRLALTATAFGVLAMSAYDMLFVRLFNQGWWYLPVSALFVSLAGLEALARVRLPPAAVVASAAAASLAVFTTLSHPAGYHDGFARFYLDEAPEIRADLRARPPRLLAWEDGIDAYALGFPAMSGTGLMLDGDAWDAWYDGRLLDTALRRGFDRFSSVSYLDTDGLDASTSSAELRRRLQPLFAGEDLAPYDFVVEERAGAYVLIRVSRGP
jgi:hypothetical protein